MRRTPYTFAILGLLSLGLLLGASASAATNTATAENAN